MIERAIAKGFESLELEKKHLEDKKKLVQGKKERLGVTLVA